MSEINIQTIEVPVRGCGFRKKGGFYLVGDMPSFGSSWFPAGLKCPCGHQFMKPSRSVQGLIPASFWPDLAEPTTVGPRFKKDERAWAVTIDGRGYPTPESWIEEGKTDGISRRLNNGWPKGFKLGESRVFVIHGKAMQDGKGKMTEPGVIACFRPTAIQYVVRGDEKQAHLQQLQDRGITLVNVPNAK